MKVFKYMMIVVTLLFTAGIYSHTTITGIVVDEVQGFRRFMDQEFANETPETIVRCERFLAGTYQRGDQAWPVFNLFDLVESNVFLQAAAE